MNKYTKISITMLTISFSILMVQFLYGYVQNIESEVLNTENEEILESIDFEPNEYGGYSFLFLVNDNTCAPCIHNTREYIGIIGDEYQIIVAHKINKSNSDVERLQEIYGTEEYKNYGVEMDKPIRNRIIMLDNEMNQISYSYISSSIVTDSARKKTIIDRHISEINIK